MATTREDLQLAPVLTSVGEARHFVGWTLAGLGAGEMAEVALLLTSELVTNALLHAGGAIRVSVTGDDDRVRVSVEDMGGGQPLRRAAGGDAVDGRGLHLVAELSERWGIDLRDGGKAVWFELAT